MTHYYFEFKDALSPAEKKYCIDNGELWKNASGYQCYYYGISPQEPKDSDKEVQELKKNVKVDWKWHWQGKHPPDNPKWEKITQV